MEKTWGWMLSLATAIGFLGMSGASAFAAGADTKIVLQLNNHNAEVNGEKKTLDVAPMILEGRTMVPLRFISDAIGASLDWAEAEQKITLTLGSDTVVLWIQKAEALVNGESVTLDVPAQVVNDRTLVPVRFVSEKLKKQVAFNEANGVITITGNEMVSEGSTAPAGKADSSTGGSGQSTPAATDPFVGNTYRLYMNQGLDVGTLNVSSDGTYIWDSPFTEQPYQGKWTKSDNGIALQGFGMQQDQEYKLYAENGKVCVALPRGSSGDGFEAEKL